MKKYNYTPLFEESCPSNINYTIGIVVKADIETVWNNVCKAENVKKYFTTDARRDLDKGGEIMWMWGNEAALINVLEVYPDDKIVFEWNGSNVEYRIRTEFTFENSRNKVKLKIKETGWLGDEPGVKSAFANCSGWTEFLNALKVYTEFNISYLNK